MTGTATDSIEIDGIKLVRTCEASPEQYDCFNSDGTRIGYLRLRWGTFEARVPDVCGTTVYSRHFVDGMKGCFDDDERELFLRKAVEAIRDQKDR